MAIERRFYDKARLEQYLVQHKKMQMEYQAAFRDLDLLIPTRAEEVFPVEMGEWIGIIYQLKELEDGSAFSRRRFSQP